MRLVDIVAIAHPAGNRIDLTWRNPDPVAFPGLRVVRRERTHPTAPEPPIASDGVGVADTTPLAGESLISQDAAGIYHATDRGLQSEVTYYYSLFAYNGAPRVYDIDRANRTSVMATGPWDHAGQMYELLPAIYQRYDTALPLAPPSDMTAEDRLKGQLLRFLELTGVQLDQIYSLTRAAANLYDLQSVDGVLLPLLAQWIGWKTDFRREIARQRNELRDAPSLYHTVQILPTVEATVKRVSGWESRTKEFVYNVLATNHPERLNVWRMLRNNAGTWSVPELVTLNSRYEGRSAAVIDGTGLISLFFHTFRRRRWEIREKRRTPAGAWLPTEVVVSESGIESRHPSAAFQGTRLWLFWDRFNKATSEWSIALRTRVGGGAWSAVSAFGGSGQRRSPVAVGDGAGNVWLFWLELVGSTWRLRYNRHNGVDWELNPPAAFPDVLDPRVEEDVFVLFRPTAATQRVWVFWARREPPGIAEQTRWTVCYRVKSTDNPALFDWGPVRVLPKPDTVVHDREPAAVLDAAGDIEVFWSSDREGGWSVFRSTLTVATETFGPAERITSNIYSQRSPLPVVLPGGELLLLHGSSQNVIYTSEVYSATETIDYRAAGATAIHTRDAAKIALRGEFDDYGTYTYDTGPAGARNNDDWYARDTVGLFVTPDTADPAAIDNEISRMTKVLKEFMPIQDRPVFIRE